VLSGTKSVKLPGAMAYIVNYDILADRLDDLIDVGAQALIIDESHFIKNSGTGTKPVKRSEAALKLAAEVRKNTDGLVLLLSGTPIVNRPIELINQLKALGRLNAFGGMSGFKRRYCGMSFNGFGATYNGSSNELELHELLRQTCMIRRLKADVLPELPARRHAEVWLELNAAAKARYKAIEDDVVGFLAHRARELAAAAGEDGDKAAWEAAMRAEAALHLVRIAALKRAAMQAKLPSALEWIDSFLDDDDDAKIILFAEHVEAVETLAERYAENYGAVKVRGGVKPEDRQRAVDAFQTNPATRVFAANFESGKEGLTLTAASNVAFIQLGWTPGGHDQAIDRCYGRVNDPHGATGHYLMAADTIDEDIYTLLAEKRAVVNAVIDGIVDENPGSNSSILGDLVIKLAQRGMARS
jgi:SNF2 family DNA or RNA helicase